MSGPHLQDEEPSIGRESTEVGTTSSIPDLTGARSALEGDVMSLTKKCSAEFIGTFWLVFGGCGAAVFDAAFPNLGIGYIGVALAFGLTLLTMFYAIGYISGCHLNPAVTAGMAVARRMPAREVPFYIISQLAGAVLASALLFVIASGKVGFDVSAGFAANGYGAHSPGGYSLNACLLAETILTFMFLMVILGATDRRAPQHFAGIAMGLGLTLIHLIGIPITNLSVNPARSTGPALFVGGWAIEQLWLFWIAPIVGAILAAIVYSALTHEAGERTPRIATGIATQSPVIHPSH
jgi:aquaporin Z